MEKIIFSASLKSLKKGVGSRLDPDPLARGTDLRIQIHTKMSRIPTLLFSTRKAGLESGSRLNEAEAAVLVTMVQVQSSQ
jgi:hypothetical protein